VSGRREEKPEAEPRLDEVITPGFLGSRQCCSCSLSLVCMEGLTVLHGQCYVCKRTGVFVLAYPPDSDAAELRDRGLILRTLARSDTGVACTSMDHAGIYPVVCPECIPRGHRKDRE
jgi:hypothetical protein